MAGESRAQTCDGPNPDKTAVLVYFVGLMVFEHQRQANPPALVAYVPDVAGHSIELFIGERDRTGRGLKWKSTNVSSSNTDLTLKLPPNASSLEYAPTQLLTAKKLHPEEKPQAIHRTSADLTLRFTRGKFSTCSFVVDEDNRICEVQLGDTKMDPMAETMVLEIEIPCTDAITIQGVTPEVNVKPILYHQMPDPFYPEYKRIFEIGVVNVQQTMTGRQLTTDHTRHLKDMFQDPKGSWSPTTAHNCQVPETNRCFHHFAYFLPRFSGFNRPICPLIEGP